MGDTQSAQRESKEDAVAEEQSSRADDVQTEQTTEDTDDKVTYNMRQKYRQYPYNRLCLNTNFHIAPNQQ